MTGWAINMVEKVITLTHILWYNISTILDGIPKKSARVSNRKWFRLIITLCRALPKVTGETVISIRLHDKLKTDYGL